MNKMDVVLLNLHCCNRRRLERPLDLPGSTPPWPTVNDKQPHQKQLSTTSPSRVAMLWRTKIAKMSTQSLFLLPLFANGSTQRTQPYCIVYIYRTTLPAFWMLLLLKRKKEGKAARVCLDLCTQKVFLSKKRAQRVHLTVRFDELEAFNSPETFSNVSQPCYLVIT